MDMLLVEEYDRRVMLACKRGCAASDGLFCCCCCCCSNRSCCCCRIFISLSFFSSSDVIRFPLESTCNNSNKVSTQLVTSHGHWSLKVITF